MIQIALTRLPLTTTFLYALYIQLVATYALVPTSVSLIGPPIDLVTVFDAILKQTREKLRCLDENLMSNNFRLKRLF